MVVSIVEQARDRVRATGARVTGARIKVLAALMDAGEALAHNEVQRRLEQGDSHEFLDRVTLYRVLDWLVEAGLAHRVSGSDRAWRYSAQVPENAGGVQHGHFKCRQCERVFCMDSPPGLHSQLLATLPAGFTCDEFELTVLGRCATCAVGAARN